MGERPLPRNIRDEAFIQGERAFIMYGFDGAIDGAPVRRGRTRHNTHVLDPGLDHIDGIGHDGGDQSGEERRHEVCGEAVFEDPAGEQRLLELVVARQLGGRDDHGTHNCGQGASP